jgi:hypothetical protein
LVTDKVGMPAQPQAMPPANRSFAPVNDFKEEEHDDLAPSNL